MSLVIVTDATGEPVSPAEIREHCKIQSTAEERLLRSYTKSAVAYAENLTKRDFMPKTRKLTFTDFATEFDLPRAPLSTVASNVIIEYTNSTGGTSTVVKSSVSTCQYVIDFNSEPGRIHLAYDGTWPETRDIIDNVRITYKSGYALDASSNVTTPEAIKDWIKMRVNQMHKFREPVVAGETLRYLRRDFVDGMLDPYIIISHETGKL